jgi:CRP-like cAMP-binding protein
VKSRYVGDAPFFSALSEEEQDAVSQRMHLEHRRSGEILFRQDDESIALYLIKSGWVRLMADSVTVLATQGPGSLVGETDLFLGRRRSLGATIVSDTELWVLTRQDLNELITTRPTIGLRLATAFGARLAAFDQYLIDNRLKPLPFLAGLGHDALKAVARRLVPVEKQQGEMIVERGQPSQALFIVETGQVHLLSSEEGGDFSELQAGETFGEMALLTGKPHAHSAQAASDAILWVLPAAEFNALAEKYPALRLSLSNILHEPLLTEDLTRAADRLATMPLFAGLTEDSLLAVAQRLLLRHIPAGELIFAEGTPGDALYLIDTGEVEIASESRRGSAVLARLGASDFFGEMALLTGRPRSTAARAAAHTNLWVLYRTDFEDLINRHPAISLTLSKALSQRLADMDRRFTENHLRGLGLLTGLSPSQLEEISRKMKPARYRQGEVIIREGEPGDDMYFIESGQVQVVRGQGTAATILAELGVGDLFGEMAMLTGNPRSATVTALTDVDLWLMSRACFDEVAIAYPSLVLALSRLLSERLRSTDERFLRRPAGAAAAPLPQHAVQAVPGAVSTQMQPAATLQATQPMPVPQRTVKQAAQTTSARSAKPKAAGGNILSQLTSWFGGLSQGAKIRLVIAALLIAWLVLVAMPILVISTLAAEDVIGLEGAVAFVQTETPLPTWTPLPTATPIPPTATPTPIPPTNTPLPTDTPVPPTETPLPTDTPLPPTETPLPPTSTPKPKPTRAPVTPTAAAAAAGGANAAPGLNKLPPRQIDPRIALLNVTIVEAQNLKSGQQYWRLTELRWQDGTESNSDHTIYIEVKDQAGQRIVGQPVEVRWQDGSLTLFIEDKPPPVYGGNFPMYNTLGSYSVTVPGLPSDTVVGLGMGTPEQPNFTIHTNFFLTFQKVTKP